MRKRFAIAAGAALVLAAGGAVAFADSGDDRSGTSTTKTKTVTLPTGDKVSVSPNGNHTWQPGEGRKGKGYITPPAADGSKDLITIPYDRMDEIAKGEEDPRRYNVTELLRSGERDAAKAKSLSHKKYGRFLPVGHQKKSVDVQDVTITVTDRDGKPSQFGFAVYINPQTDDYGEIELDKNGQATVQLRPGQYDFHTDTVDDNDNIVLGITSVTVKDKPVKATADGTKSNPVKFNVDRPAEVIDHGLRPFSVRKDGSNYGILNSFGSEFNGYLIPNGDDKHKTGVEAAPHLIGTDPADPYTYDLNFFETNGIPADPTFTAHDEDLAQVERTFDGLITKDPTIACNNVIREGGAEFASCELLEVKWGTKRTEYVTPGADLTWYANALIGDPQSDESISIEGSAHFEAGPAKAVTGKAPVSFNVGGTYEEPILTRKGDKMSMYLPFMDNANRAEVIEDFHTIKGTAVLKRDGKEIGRKKLTSPFATFTLPKKDSGTYTLSTEMSHSKDYTPLATKTKVKWTFKSKPTSKDTPLNVSAVAFDAEGVSGGYADVKKQQNFTLDFQAQEGAKDTKLKKLTFEVSYDDGKTWKKVKVKVKGDTATGKLKHPKDAKFVSVRATATDDAGNKATHSTVHTYGLK
ncbi:hypothetical protein [Stackebrandtia nassauensis]|uniref:Uncharacterized protein n=1 Tax=Stackebrandtia nassauensis (strain DSM 44728 / CIP 108903 / NRRL B-16338 / NBRC 102104 / LLR-40K-21) TaxID=446470 RepID=D3Q0J1_STANL|nr:hypothetical protein [Stackebrandtia nassauensis]ADD41727.1 hypothetical protein Snas_2032 [Stackebrandtia nassauensis DSM 44728]